MSCAARAGGQREEGRDAREAGHLVAPAWLVFLGLWFQEEKLVKASF